MPGSGLHGLEICEISRILKTNRFRMDGETNVRVQSINMHEHVLKC